MNLLGEGLSCQEKRGTLPALCLLPSLLATELIRRVGVVVNWGLAKRGDGAVCQAGLSCAQTLPCHYGPPTCQKCLVPPPTLNPSLNSIWHWHPAK